MLNQTPFCQRQDCRVQGSNAGRMTLAYYPPILDKQGTNINPDRNVTSYDLYCQTCGKSWEQKTINGQSTIHNLRG